MAEPILTDEQAVAAVKRAVALAQQAVALYYDLVAARNFFTDFEVLAHANLETLLDADPLTAHVSLNNLSAAVPVLNTLIQTFEASQGDPAVVNRKALAGLSISI